MSWEPQATDAGAPVLGATGFRLYTDSGTVTWDVGGNPEGTRYEVLLTTGAVIGGEETRTFYWEQVGVLDQTYELPQDLIKNKEYRVRVEAVGHNMKRVSSAERSGTTNSDRPGAVVLVVNGEEPTRKMVLTWTPNRNDEGRHAVWNCRRRTLWVIRWNRTSWRGRLVGRRLDPWDRTRGIRRGCRLTAAIIGQKAERYTRGLKFLWV